MNKWTKTVEMDSGEKISLTRFSDRSLELGVERSAHAIRFAVSQPDLALIMEMIRPEAERSETKTKS